MSDSSKSSLMADLLAKHKSPLTAVSKGQIVKGTITKLTPSEILVDVGTKTEAVVLEKDRRILKQLLSLLKVGDTVEASVLNPESDMGYPILSLRGFADNKIWASLENLAKTQEKIQATITEVTKGGFLATTQLGITGFLPNSHVSYSQDNQNVVGSQIDVSIVDLQRDQRKVVLSQKEFMSVDDFKKAVKNLKRGDKVTGTVSSITAFGVFVVIPAGNNNFVDGLIHISEVSWEKVQDLSGLFKVGEEIEVSVMGFDNDAKRVDLSIKRLAIDPFEEIAKAYPLDKKVTGTIRESGEMGLAIDLPEVNGIAVEGLIRKDKIPPTVKYDVGQEITATVVQIDTRKRKILLTPVLLEKPLMYR